MPHHDEIINPFIKIHNFNVTWINLAFDIAYMVEVSFVNKPLQGMAPTECPQSACLPACCSELNVTLCECVGIKLCLVYIILLFLIES